MASTSITELIDRAITDVAREKFEEACLLFSVAEVAQKSENALHGLVDDLSTQKNPSYDEWTANFYLQWYQARQIFLAYQIFSKELSEQLSDHARDCPKEPVILFDFGAGSMAALVGLVIAIAKLPITPQWLPQVHVCNQDPSSAMLDLGRAFWSRFKALTGRYAPNSRLKSVMENATFNTTTDVYEYKILADEYSRRGGAKILTSFHTIYREPRHQLKSVGTHLDRVWCALRPQKGWLTANENSQSLVNDLHDDLTHLEINRKSVNEHDRECICDRKLNQITRFRSDVMLPKLECFLKSSSRNLLRAPVPMFKHNNLIYEIISVTRSSATKINPVESVFKREINSNVEVMSKRPPVNRPNWDFPIVGACDRGHRIEMTSMRDFNGLEGLAFCTVCVWPYRFRLVGERWITIAGNPNVWG